MDEEEWGEFMAHGTMKARSVWILAHGVGILGESGFWPQALEAPI